MQWNRSTVRRVRSGRRRSQRLFMEQLESRQLLASVWQNPMNPGDINNDGLVTPADVLSMINEINNPQIVGANGQLPETGSQGPPFLDPTGDCLLVPTDVLNVINRINQDDQPPEISISLAEDTGPLGETNDDLISSNPAIVGSVTDVGTGTNPTLRVEVNGNEVFGVTAAADGSFAFQPALLRDGTEDGEQVISVVAQDARGNVSEAATFQFVLDTLPPDPPSAPDLIDGDDTGESSTDDLTNRAYPRFAGTTDSETGVELRSGEQTIGLTDGEPFEWEVRAAVPFADGEHEVTAVAWDHAGNQSAPSTPLTITVDTESPAIPTNIRLTDGTDLGLANDDDLTSNSSPTVTGDGESETTIAVLVDAEVVGETPGDAQFDVPLNTLPDGLYEVRATARDAAGNESGFSESAFVEIDTVPSAPLFTEVSPQRDSVTVFFDADLGVGANQLANYTLKSVASGQEMTLVSADVDGAAVQLIPASPFEAGERYELTVATDVADLAGNQPAEPTTLTFRSTSSLLINTTSPRTGEDDVALTREAIIRFTQQVDPATITPESVKVIALGEPVDGRLAVSSTERFVTFFPSEPWSPSTEVRIEIDGDLIVGRNGESLDADKDGTPGGTAAVDFRTLPLTRIEGTGVFGYVYDAYTQEPIEGVTIRADGLPELNAVTDATGFFRLEDTPAPLFFVHIDGTTAVSAPAGMGYPNVGKPFHSVAGQETQLHHHGHTFDIYLPQMAAGDLQDLSPTEATDVGFGAAGLTELADMFPGTDPSEWAKLAVTFLPGSAQDDAGTAVTQATIIPVPPDRLPAPLPSGFDPALVVSIQAPGANNFDIPAPVTFPNLDNLPLGSEPTIWSFDHDQGVFAPLGKGEVVDDDNGGTIIRSAPGVGILAPGWHFTSPDLYWLGNRDEPVGNGRIQVIDPVETPLEARLIVLSEEYGADAPQDTYIFRFNPPPGPAELSDDDHILSTQTKVTREAGVTITNPDWFRVLYELNPTFDRLLAPNGNVRIQLGPNDPAVTLSAKLRPQSEVLRLIKERDPTVLYSDGLFASLIRVEEYTTVDDPETGAKDTTAAIKNKIPLILLDLADDASDGVLKFADLNVAGLLSSKSIRLLGGQRGLRLSGELLDEDGFDNPPAELRLGEFLSRTVLLEASPQGETGKVKAKLAFKVTLLDEFGRPTETIDVAGPKPGLEAQITPVRQIYLNQDQFLAEVAAFTDEPANDFAVLGHQLENVLDRAVGSLRGIEIFEGSCGSCNQADQINIQWSRQRQGTLARPVYGRAEDTRFNTRTFVDGALKLAEDGKSLVLDEDVPLARQRYFLDQAFNDDEPYGGDVDIFLGSAFADFSVGDLSNNDRSTRVMNDLAVTVGHEFLHLSGLAHTDLTGVSNRDILNSATYYPATYSALTKESAHFALDGSTAPLGTPAANRVTAQLQRWVAALNHPIEKLERVFPDAREVVDSLFELRQLEVPSTPALRLSEETGLAFEFTAFSLGEVSSDGAAGEVATQTYFVENFGDRTVEINSVGLLDGAQGFSVTGLAPGATIEPRETAEFQIEFDPAVVGEVRDTILLGIDVAPEDGPNVFEFELVATGLPPAPTADVIVELENNNFGGIELGGGTPLESALTVTNLGVADLVFTPTLTGADADYHMDGMSGAELSLARGESVTIPLAFVPTEVGLRPVQVTLSTNDPTQPIIQRSFVGTGVPTGGIGADDFHWGNDYVRLVDGPLITNVLTDDGGNFELAVSTQADYTIEVFDPQSGFVASFSGHSGDSGGFGDVSRPLTFEASTAPDSDGDGLPDDAESAIGSNLAAIDTDGDGLSDFAEILAGLDPLDGIAFPTGVIARLGLPGGAQAISLEADPDGRQLAYAAIGDGGLAVVDVTRFDRPALLGQLPLPGRTSDLAVVPSASLAIVAAGDEGLQLVDISDPMLPRLSGAVGLAAEHVEVFDEVAYVASGTSLTSVDIRTGERGELLSKGDQPVTGLASEGAFLYTMQEDRTLTVHEVDGLKITALGSLQLPHGGGEIFAADSTLYAAAIGSFFRGGFATVDVSDPAAPQLISGSDVVAPNIEPGLAVAPNGSGLAVLIGTPSDTTQHAAVVVDVTDPAETFVAVEDFPLSDPPQALVMGGGFALIGDSTSLAVLNYQAFDNLGQPPTVSVAAETDDVDTETAGIQVFEGTTIPLAVTTTDDVQVRSVELLVQGQVVQTDVSFPWDLSTIAPTLADGSSTLSVQVRATDTGGNETTSPPLTIEITEDDIAPTIDFLSPADGVSGSPGTQVVTIQFSEAIDETTLTSDNIRLMSASGAVVAPSTISLRKDDSEFRATYPNLGVGSFELRIAAANITDRAGNSLGTEDVVSEFTLQVPDLLGLYPNLLLATPNELSSVGILKHVAAGDINGDGRDDMVSVGNFSTTSQVHVFLSNAMGGFDPPEVVGNSARGAHLVYLERINDDAHLDIVVGHSSAAQVAVLLGNGTGQFAEPVLHDVSQRQSQLLFGDLDGNGKQDILAVAFGASTSLLGDGAGGFTRQDDPLRTTGGVLGHFDGDGQLDLVAEGNREFNFYAGNGDGTFADPVPSQSLFDQELLAGGDFNGDQKLDLVIAGRNVNFAGEAVILPGNGDGTFGAAESVYSGATGFGAGALSVRDLNDDGVPDLAIGRGATTESVALVLSDGQGGFTTTDVSTPARDAESLTFGDVNGDGLPDLVSADTDRDQLIVQLGVGGGLVASTQESSFGTSQEFPNSNFVQFQAELANLTDDQAEDLVVTVGTRSLYVYTAAGDGTFGGRRTLNVTQRVTDLLTADLNQDGRSDILALDQGQDSLSVFFSNADGTFTQRNVFAGDAPAFMVVGDVTGDDAADVLLHLPFSDQILTLRNDGNGGLLPHPRALNGLPDMFGMQLGDLNGDGILDLLVFEQTGAPDARVVVRLGEGDNAFGAPTPYTVSRSGPGVVLKTLDLNADGNLDVVAFTPSFSTTLNVLLGDGSGALTPAPDVELPLAVVGAEFRDVDADGHLDLIGAEVSATDNQFSSRLALHKGRGDGTFEAPTSFGTVSRAAPRFLAVGDIDEDGDTDVVTGFSNRALAMLGGGKTGFGGDPLELTLEGSPGLRVGEGTPGKLRVGDVATVYQAALERWRDLGLADSHLQVLGSTQVVISDLPGARVGTALGNTIYIDPTAAGSGWYVDPEPADDIEYLDGDQPENGQVDLLTVVLHEMGHVLGLADVESQDGDDDLMLEQIGLGQRRLPTAELVDRIMAE